MAEESEESIVAKGSDMERESRRVALLEAERAEQRRRMRPRFVLKRKVLPQEMLAIAGGFGLLAFVIYTEVSASPPLNPIFPLMALIFFLYPFRRIIIPRRLIQLAVITFVLWLALNLMGVLFPFLAAFVFAYLFSPVVKQLNGRGIPRWGTSLLLVLGILGVYTLIGVFIIPGLLEQFNQLFASAGTLVRDTQSLLDRDRLIAWLTDIGIPRQQATEFITNTVEPQLKNLVTWFYGYMPVLLKNVQSLLEGVFNLILIPILTFYMLLDFEKIRNFVGSTLLQDNPDYIYYVKQVDLILSSYMRGIIITSSLVAAMSVAILSMFRVPYAVLLGILTGIFNLIPTFGIFLNLGVAIIVFLFVGADFWENTLITAIMIAGLHGLNAYLVEPRVLGERVGLHPVLLIASLFVFGHFLGFVGLLVAVPSTAVILMFLREWYNRTIALRRPVTVTPGTPAANDEGKN